MTMLIRDQRFLEWLDRRVNLLSTFDHIKDSEEKTLALSSSSAVADLLQEFNQFDEHYKNVFRFFYPNSEGNTRSLFFRICK